MSKDFVRPEPPKPEEIAIIVNGAADRLSTASKAINGFYNLLCGYDDMAALKAEQLACLLEPIRMEVDAALDELHCVTIKDGAQNAI